MSRIKDFLDAVNNQSFETVAEQSVCIDCFDDYGIRNFILANSTGGRCDFCHPPNRRRTCSINAVLEHVTDCLGREYESPNEHMSWDSAEGGWLGTVYNGADILFDCLGIDVSSEELRYVISRAMLDSQWCDKSPFGYSPGEDLYFLWEHFAQLVKHKARYVFLQMKTSSKTSTKKGGAEGTCRILSDLGRFAKKYKLVHEKSVSSAFYRARRTSEKKLFRTAAEMGPPPPDASTSNRMSPMGIPMFYGALEPQTTLAEIADANPGDACVAEFLTLRTIRLLDLTKIPDVPSIFDGDAVQDRDAIIFLKAFLDDFSKPVAHDGREHLEYVPTQLVTEYFRHVFRFKRGQIDGILYPSSRCSGTSCVLFLESENCTDDGRISTTSSEQRELILSMNTKSARVEPLPTLDKPTHSSQEDTI